MLLTHEEEKLRINQNHEHESKRIDYAHQLKTKTKDHRYIVEMTRIETEKNKNYREIDIKKKEIDLKSEDSKQHHDEINEEMDYQHKLDMKQAEN